MILFQLTGIIKHGGVKPSIIPDYTELEYCFRAPSKKELDQLREKMRACFESAATGTGCQVSKFDLILSSICKAIC